MRSKAWKLYNRTMDGVAMVFFPANKPTRFRIGTHRLHSTDITIAIYTLLIGLGLAWYFENWLWFPATVLSMVMSWMLLTWFF